MQEKDQGHVVYIPLSVDMLLFVSILGSLTKTSLLLLSSPLHETVLDTLQHLALNMNPLHYLVMSPVLFRYGIKPFHI